ncbi:MAG: DNA-binding protein [Giesbergeria sp.]|uniref:DNA-binding protein n=1 Tax=Giesbergeria sp. TaxID=2818473 RepID=UPI0026350335|nr:DNA-binding protein [Giesbergeria sp.]MDD2610947.1 DNA-binding protein [Giesbergeria sp.]
MRPTEFSDEEIVRAGLELQSEGKNVTGFALRQRVGGGSASRLRTVWTEYTNSQNLAPKAPVVELPQEIAEQLNLVSAALNERLKTLAATLHDKAVKAADRRVAELVHATDEQRKQSERELADAGLAVDELEEKLDAALAERELLRTKLDESNTVIQHQAIEIAQLTERLRSTTELLTSTDERLKAESAKASAAREEAARYAGQIDVLERQNAELSAKLEQRSSSS